MFAVTSLQVYVLIGCSMECLYMYSEIWKRYTSTILIHQQVREATLHIVVSGFELYWAAEIQHAKGGQYTSSLDPS